MRSVKVSRYLLAIFLTVFLPSLCAQTPQTSPWIRVENKLNQNLRIDVSTIKKNNDTDIYIWALEVHKQPLLIEGIDQKIYKTKTYYILNSKLKRYSILEIVLYDSLNAVIKDFNYRKNLDQVSLKYNYPIIAESPVEAILQKSTEYLARGNGEKH